MFVTVKRRSVRVDARTIVREKRWTLALSRENCWVFQAVRIPPRVPFASVHAKSTREAGRKGRALIESQRASLVSWRMSTARSVHLANGRTLRGVVETMDVRGNEIEHAKSTIH
jgi:hypothetical protein